MDIQDHEIPIFLYGAVLGAVAWHFWRPVIRSMLHDFRSALPDKKKHKPE